MNNYIILESAFAATTTNVVNDERGTAFTAVLQKANYKNRNGRIYPKEVLDEAIHSPIVQEKMRTRTLFGEAGHPLSTEVARQTTIDLRNVAFLIESMWWDGDMLKAKCRTTSTMAGKDMAGLISDGCTLSFSLRAQGNVIKDPTRDALVVQRPLNIIGWDWVWLPSNQDAYMISQTTQESMYNLSAYANASMALTESMNLFENGAMIEATEEKPMEKKIYNYVESFTKKTKPINEMYFFDKADEIKEINESCVVLESATAQKTVSTKDYVLKSLRAELLEDIAGIAPLDVRYVPHPLEAKDLIAPTVTTKDVRQSLTHDEVDVKPVEVAGGVKLEQSTEPVGNEKTLSNDEKDGVANDPEEKEQIQESGTKMYARDVQKDLNGDADAGDRGSDLINGKRAAVLIKRHPDKKEKIVELAKKGKFDGLNSDREHFANSEAQSLIQDDKDAEAINKTENAFNNRIAKINTAKNGGHEDPDLKAAVKKANESGFKSNKTDKEGDK